MSDDPRTAAENARLDELLQKQGLSDDEKAERDALMARPPAPDAADQKPAPLTAEERDRLDALHARTDLSAEEAAERDALAEREPVPAAKEPPPRETAPVEATDKLPAEQAAPPPENIGQVPEHHPEVHLLAMLEQIALGFRHLAETLPAQRPLALIADKVMRRLTLVRDKL